MIHGTFIEAFGEFSKEITFLSRAVCKDEYRASRGYILIEPSDTESGKLRGVASDGKRLHIVDPLSSRDGIGLEAGNWRPLKRGGDCSWIAQIKEDREMFPDYRRVIPRDKALFTFNLRGIPRGNDMGDIASTINFFREFPEPTAINWNYLNALDCSRFWEVSWYGSVKPVLFKSGSYTAVIATRLMD